MEASDTGDHGVPTNQSSRVAVGLPVRSIRQRRAIAVMAAMSAGAALIGVVTARARGAQTDVWIAGGKADITNSASNYSSGSIPANGDTFNEDGAGSVVNYSAADTAVFTSLAAILLEQSTTSQTVVFNQTGGTLAVTTITGSTGASKNFIYSLTGGAVLNVTTVNFANGSASSVNLSAGTTVNDSTTLNIGSVSGAHSYINVVGGSYNFSGGGLNLGSIGSGFGNINISNGGVFNYANSANLTLGAAAGGGGTVTVSSGLFNASAAGIVYVANGGTSTAGTITLSGTGGFTAAGATVILGQFGSTTVATTPSTATLTMSGTSTFNSAGILIGGNNAVSYVNGIINMTGGTITTGYIREGATNLTASSTAMLFNSSGGTVVALSKANNSDFFSGAFVKLSSGGLTFNTSGNSVGITNALNGTGALTKTGAGILTLSGNSGSTYTGNVNVNGGTLAVANNFALGTGTTNLTGGTTLAINAQPALSNTVRGVAGFTALNTNSISTYTPVVAGSMLSLTSAVAHEATSAFSPTPVTINDAYGFTMSFTYNHTTLGAQGAVANGVTFTIQNQSTGALGGSGMALGYGLGTNTNGDTAGTAIAPSGAVVIDLLHDTAGYGINGSTTLATANALPFLSAAVSTNVAVSYNGATQQMIETFTSGTSAYTVLAGIDFAATLGGSAGGSGTGYLGFTAATGNVFDAQSISNFVFNNTPTASYAIANPVVVAPGAMATLQLAPTALFSGGGVGPITVGTGGTLSLVIGSGAVYGVTHGVLSTTSVTFTNRSSGTLDVGRNDLDITGQSLTSVNALVASGYNSPGGGNWAGPGITSTVASVNTSHLTALGVIVNNDGGKTLYGVSGSIAGNFDGITPSATDILVKYTYYGDANLDGKVDGSDYSRIDASYLAEQTGGSISGWYNGDFNYDGVVNGSDYSLMDNAFNTQAASLALATGASPLAVATVGVDGISTVPEPSTSPWGLGAIGMLVRRCRRRAD